MKALLMTAALVLFGTGSALATEEIPYIDAHKTTCGEIQVVLYKSGVAHISGRYGNQTHYAQYPQCEMGYQPQYTYVRSSDSKFCGAGFTCQLYYNP